MSIQRTIPCVIWTLLIAASTTAQAPAAGDAILGQWYTADNASKVLVVKSKGKYEGTIIWLDEPRYNKEDAEAGKIKHDRKNPDKKLKARKLVGLQILKNFVYDKDDKAWNSGTIYDPEVGKVYKCTIKPVSDPKVEGGKRLDVRGYIGFPALGRTTAWTRVPKDELEDLDES